jgi:DNA polymerase-3 subunit epsilon
MVDTVRIARETIPAKNSLDALCTRYGIDRSHRTKHGALLDAELLAQVYVELAGRSSDRPGTGRATAVVETVTTVCRRPRASAFAPCPPPCGQ